MCINIRHVCINKREKESCINVGREPVYENLQLARLILEFFLIVEPLFVFNLAVAILVLMIASNVFHWNFFQMLCKL